MYTCFRYDHAGCPLTHFHPFLDVLIRETRESPPREHAESKDVTHLDQTDTGASDSIGAFAANDCAILVTRDQLPMKFDPLEQAMPLIDRVLATPHAHTHIEMLDIVFELEQIIMERFEDALAIQFGEDVKW